MQTISKETQRNLFLPISLVVVLAVLIIVFISFALNGIVHGTLQQEAERKASAWVYEFVAQVPNLKRLADTEYVTTAQIDFINASMGGGEIFLFKFFSPTGKLKYVSEEAPFTAFEEGVHSIRAINALASRENDIAIRQSENSPTRPDTYVEAYIPAVLPSGQAIGVVEVYVDVSSLASTLNNLVLRLGALLVSLSAIAFLIPSIILVVRNQQMGNANERKAWLAAILDNAPFEVVIKDTKGKIRAISRNVAEEFDLRPQDFIGKTTADFLPDSIANKYMLADNEVVRTGEATQKEMVETTPISTRYSLSSKFPVVDKRGQITGICSFTSDITDLKTSEEKLAQAQKMEAVGQLTGGIAHDFNNLLAVILGNAEFLDELGSEASPFAEAIVLASERGADLTQRLLAFSRQQPLNPEAVDLTKLITDMTVLLQRTLGETIEIKTLPCEDIWLASADQSQVENALLNLAINSRDAMPNGGKLTIECSNTRIDHDNAVNDSDLSAGEYVVLSVSDHGIGMSKETQSHAFEPFFTTKETGQGSGLGLSMVYGFAQQSGGQATIYSELGKGTTIRLYLPRAHYQTARDERPQKEAVPKGHGETILVIEDDPQLQDLAELMLTNLDYKVVSAENVQAARQALEAHPEIALVLSDVVLPGGTSGPEFAAELRATHPNLQTIFMSGYPAEAAKRNGFLGSDRVLLNKPFRVAELAKEVSEILG